MILTYRFKIILTLITASAAILLFSTYDYAAAKDFNAPTSDFNTEITDSRFFKGKSFVSNIKFSDIKIPITIVYHGKEQKHMVSIDTVENTLISLGINLEINDVLPFDKGEYIFPNQTINIPRIETSAIEISEAVNYKSETVYSDKMLSGESKIIQHGQNGVKKVTYRQLFFNGSLWRSYVVSEQIITPAKNEITEIGTQSILKIQNDGSKNGKSVLLKTNNDDDKFSLPKIELSENNRDLLERIVTGEFGSSYIGSCLIAQAIKCAIVYDGYTSIQDLIIGMGYVGDTNQKSQNAVEAVKFIFDENGLAVKHRLFYMCTEDYYNSEPGNFHSTQNFILQYENVKFFDRW